MLEGRVAVGGVSEVFQISNELERRLFLLEDVRIQSISLETDKLLVDGGI